MNITFDTNILLAATLWDGSISQKLLFSLIRQNVVIYSSPAILEEYQNVLVRDFAFSAEDVSEITQKILSFVTLVTPQETLHVVASDPKDNIIVECAVESQSTYIITHDKHLLNMKSYNEIKIITPEEARAIF